MRNLNKFVNAIADMYENGELDRICRMQYSRAFTNVYMSRIYTLIERMRARRFKRFLDDLSRHAEIRSIPFILLMMRANSAEVLKTAICMMETSEDV